MSCPWYRMAPEVIWYLGWPIRQKASVLLPEPLGPMMACTSPEGTARERPLTISLPSTATCRSSILKTAPFLLILPFVAPLLPSKLRIAARCSAR